MTFKRIKERRKVEKEYSKSDLKAISSLEETLRKDIVSVIGNIDNTKKALNLKINVLGGKEKLEENNSFLLKKINYTISTLDESLAKLNRLNRLDKLKLKHMHEAYVQLTQANKEISILREFIYRLNKDNTEQ